MGYTSFFEPEHILGPICQSFNYFANGDMLTAIQQLTDSLIKYRRKALLIHDNPRFVLPYLQIT